MSTYIERLKIEHDELEEKIYKLNDFVDSEAFDELSERNQQLLVLQSQSMAQYRYILSIRLSQ